MHWDPMTYDQYADFENATSHNKIITADEHYWKPSGRIFYRPLNPFQKLSRNQARRFKPSFGMKQYATDEPETNTCLNLIVFKNTEAYDPGLLPKNPKKNIRKAEKEGLTVREIETAEALTKRGHPVYVSHVKRTGYTYNAERLDFPVFEKWAHDLYRFPKVKILGVYRDDMLLSFEINSLLDHVLMMKCIVNSTEGLKFRAPDLQLHYDRLWAKEQKDIHMIFDGFVSQAESIDHFKFYRGACICCLPARLEGNPMIPLAMKLLTPSKYHLLTGLKHCASDKTCKIREEKKAFR